MGYMEKVVNMAFTTFTKATEQIKDRFLRFVGSPSASVNEIAALIQRHPDTKITKKELLGLTFTFYELKKDGISYVLEMKNTSILQLDVVSEGKKLVAYRSYADRASLNKPITLPDLNIAQN